jgi:hypothetical protein
MLHLEHSFNGAETWTLRQIDCKCLESFQVWCLRRMKTDRVENEVLQTVRGRKNRPTCGVVFSWFNDKRQPDAPLELRHMPGIRKV